MFIHQRRPWSDAAGTIATPEPPYLTRRQFVAAAGLATIAAAAPNLPARKHRDDRESAAGAGPFIEFGIDHPSARQRARHATLPRMIHIGGLVSRPRTLHLDDLMKRFPFEERTYRFRCVEGWAMLVPWLGIPMRALVEWCRPSSAARYVRFVAAHDEPLMPGIAAQPWYSWPYAEALTIAEATSELTFLATGIYGHDLPGDHGAPLRLVVPWKYGHKSIKAIARIEFTADRPATFWNSALPHEYPFHANVDPRVPHPRWSQRWEVMVGTGDRVRTQLYNGYGPFVGHLYS